MSVVAGVDGETASRHDDCAEGQGVGVFRLGVSSVRAAVCRYTLVATSVASRRSGNKDPHWDVDVYTLLTNRGNISVTQRSVSCAST